MIPLTIFSGETAMSFFDSVQCYCNWLSRLSHKRNGDDADYVTPFTNDGMSRLRFAASHLFPSASSPPFKETAMNTKLAPSADAEEICQALQLAVLKYFPAPVEDVDTFLFAQGDDGAIDHSRPACLPED
jgi:hypothetical protein